MSLASNSGMAQESGSPSFDAYEKDPSDRVFYSPGDSSGSIPSKIKDSTSIKMPVKRNVYKPAPVVPKEKNESADPDDNSILSFNFLYYLIQKYKMQDIVD
jgi:hypothetical protein